MITAFNKKQNTLAIVLVLFMLIRVILYFSGCTNTNKKNIQLSSSYEITAALDPINKTLNHTSEINITNDGQDSTKELYFHLYSNKYKTDSEGVDILSVADENGNAIQFEMQDDDQLILLTLNDTLIGGGELTITFICKVTIPAMREIYGVSRRDGEIQMAYFYPQLAIYDNNGWNLEPLNDSFDGRYLPMSHYRITISAPSDYEIVCNGIELSKETNGTQTTYIYQADFVREIVFVAHTDYTRLERAIGNTRIYGYFNPNDNLNDMEEAMDAAAFSMEFYNNAYMQYPYETLIITTAGWGASGISGMEYSGFFTSVVGGDFDYILTIYHEMAHQWFYVLIGNDENKEAWLDESFAVFSSLLCMEAAGNETFSAYWELCELQAASVDNLAINTPIDDNDVNYLNLFYGKGALFLKDLMDVIGKEEFLSILSEYCRTYAHAIATTQSFLSVLREHSPKDIESIIGKYLRE